MKTITTILAALILTVITFTASPAEAGPRFGFYVGFGMPAVVVSRPAPDYVWVKGHYAYNAFGQIVWVPAHWKEI
jgi:hypothetical protein